MSSLETSVTLEDVFTVVEAKRVPLAPELAGYLTLEIADGTDAGSGDVDPKTVFISEEGTVALVRPKKDNVTGDVEASVRRLLTKLLDASGSGTPALTTAAKRKPGNGLPALVEELEAALIPVNRAAGRRALARLAREVKRVLLGVGRNASVPPVDRRGGGAGAVGGEVKASVMPKARPQIRKRGDDDPSKEKERPSERGLDKKAAEKPAPAPPPLPPPEVSLGLGLDKVQRGDVVVRPAFDDDHASLDQPKAKSVPPPPVPNRPLTPPLKSPSQPPGPPPLPKRDALGSDLPPPPTLFGGDEVDSLLDSFNISHKHEDKQMARELKAIAGLSPTPPPPDAKTLAELTKDIGKDLPKKLTSEQRVGGGAFDIDAPQGGDSVEALLALTDLSEPGGPVRNAKVSDALAALAPPLPLPHSAPPPPLPMPGANLPPSSIFGGVSGGGGAAAGAPAALRQPPPDPLPLPGLAPPPVFNAAQPPMFRDEPPPPVRNDFIAPAPVHHGASRGGAPEPPRYDPPKPIPRPPPPPTGVNPGSASGQRARPADASGPNPVVPSAVATKRTTARQSKQGNRPRAPRTGLAMLIFALLVLGGGTAAIWKFAPQVFTGKKRPQPTATVPTAAPLPPQPKCKVALVLTEVPANAEILLRMGQAPVDVERMPVGTRLELVATAEGYAPRRAVIKGESQWDKGPDGKPRIEIPIQLDPSKAKPGALDPWPAAEPGSQVGGSGAPGTVHVVSNVRGAEVWLLAGLGPEARIDQLRCDADIDVLFAGPPTLRKRLHVSEKDISATAPDAVGNKVVNVNAK